MKMLKNYYCRCEYAKHFFCLILLAMKRATHVTMLNWWNCIPHRYCCIVIFRVSDARWNYHPMFFIYGFFYSRERKKYINDEQRWMMIDAFNDLHQFVQQNDCILWKEIWNDAFFVSLKFFTLFTCRRGRQFSLNNFWIMLFKTLFSAAFICWKLNNEKCMRFNTFNEWKKYAYFSFPYGTLFLLAVHLGITLTSQSFTHTSAILPSHVFY